MSWAQPMKEFMTHSTVQVSELNQLEEALGVQLPASYRQFLSNGGGGEGFVRDHYLVLWRARDLAEFNLGYETARDAPGFLAIGSNGAGEALGFDMRRDSRQIFRIPFVGLCWTSAVPIANDFEELFVAATDVSDSTLDGKELFFITPILLGGNPQDPENRIFLTRSQHLEAVRYWNGIIRDLRK